MSRTGFLLIGLVIIVLAGVFWDQQMDQQIKELWFKIQKWFLPSEDDFTREIELLKELEDIEVVFPEDLGELEQEAALEEVQGETVDDHVQPYQEPEREDQAVEQERQMSLLEIEQEINRISQEVEVLSQQVTELVGACESCL